MTYTAVNAICSGDSEFCTKYADIVPSVNQMQSLCLLLEEKRKNAGNIDLAVDETKIYVDENGEIIIKKNDRGIAERMIEQFYDIRKRSSCRIFAKEKRSLSFPYSRNAF